MTKKRVVLINPKTVNEYYHFSFGWLDRLFVWFFKTIYDRRFDIPSHTYCTTMPPITSTRSKRSFTTAARRP
jgi:hypothetical protein